MSIYVSSFLFFIFSAIFSIMVFLCCPLFAEYVMDLLAASVCIMALTQLPI